MPNKAIIGTLFTPRHFGVAAPLYTKALLHKQCPIWRRYMPSRGSAIKGLRS